MAYKTERTYNLPDNNKSNWVEKICAWDKYLPKSKTLNNCVRIHLGKAISKKTLTPFHIVLLSCFIERVKQKGYLIWLNIDNEKLNGFIHNDMSLTQYWRGEKADHIDSPDPSRLNLWRVVEGKSTEYEISVHKYFSNKFPGIDFFMLKSCLSELYFNIFDHANANGVAFSYIHFDENDKIIHIAICDFGKGIANTMQKAFPEIENDKEALLKSLKRGVTAQSNEHNKGFGLDNVASSLSDKSMMRIISNTAFLICLKNAENFETKAFDLSFEFKGTLIYFDLPISSFEESEIEDEFTF